MKNSRLIPYCRDPYAMIFLKIISCSVKNCRDYDSFNFYENFSDNIEDFRKVQHRITPKLLKFLGRNNSLNFTLLCKDFERAKLSSEKAVTCRYVQEN